MNVKNIILSQNLSDIPREAMPSLCHGLPGLSGPNFTLLALFLPNFAYLRMQFILQLTHTIDSAGWLQNK